MTMTTLVILCAAATITIIAGVCAVGAALEYAGEREFATKDAEVAADRRSLGNVEASVRQDLLAGEPVAETRAVLKSVRRWRQRTGRAAGVSGHG